MTFQGVDLTELDQLVVDLSQAGAQAAVRAVKVVHRAANNVMRDARDFAPSGPRTAAYPRSITYDIEVDAGTIVAEIGPDKDLPQGALGNILEYGTSTQGPQAHLGPALDRESPNFVKYMGDLGADALGFQ